LDWPGRYVSGADEIRVLSSTSEHFTDVLTNRQFRTSGVLTEEQYRIVIRALEQQRGADVMAAPQVTTLSGRQTQIQIVQVHTVLNGRNPEATSINFRTIQVPLGPTLDVIPSVELDGQTIHLALMASLTEFLGYDGTLPESKADSKIAGANTGVPFTPLPRFRVHRATAEVRIANGETFVLGGVPVSEMILRIDEAPTLGDLPLVGKLFRRESEEIVTKNVLIFVTATIVDPAENPLRP